MQDAWYDLTALLGNAKSARRILELDPDETLLATTRSFRLVFGTTMNNISSISDPIERAVASSVRGQVEELMDANRLMHIQEGILDNPNSTQAARTAAVNALNVWGNRFNTAQKNLIDWVITDGWRHGWRP